MFVCLSPGGQSLTQGETAREKLLVGTVDGTHFQENGARILARFVADGLSDAAVPLAQYRL